MAFISKNTHDPAKGYREVIFQQQRNLMDFDFNEAQAILRDSIERVATQLAETGNLIGGGGAITPDTASRSVKVAAGIAVHGGTLVRIPAVASLQVFDTLTTSGTVTSTVYVEYGDEEVTYVEDPDIHDPTFGESAARTKRTVEVKVNIGVAGLPAAPVGKSLFELGRVTHDFTADGTSVLLTDIEQDVAPSPGEFAGKGPARTLKLRSAAPDAATAYELGTDVVHTAGDILHLLNGTTRLLSLRHDGLLSTKGISAEGDIALTGNVTLASGMTVDGVDVSAFKSAYDAHNHNTSYYLKSEVDTTLGGYYTKTETDTLLGGKAAASHRHGWADLDTVPDTASRWPAWTEVTSKPTAFAPSAHAASHASGGADAITPASIGAAASSHNHDTRYYTQSAADGRFLQLTGGSLSGALTLAGTGNRLIFDAAVGTAALAHKNGATEVSLLTLGAASLTAHVATTFEKAVSLAETLAVTGRARLTGNRFDNRSAPVTASISTSAYVLVSGAGKRALVHYIKVDPGLYTGSYDVEVYDTNANTGEQLAKWTGQSGVMEDRVPWFFDSARSDDNLYVHVVKATTGTADTFSVSMKAERFA